MPIPTVFETCVPRDDVLRDAIAEADFAADLHKVLRGTATADYTEAARFFANTYPTKGVGSSRVDLQACKLEYSIVSPK